MKDSTKSYKRGEHPNSQKNLSNKGRGLQYGQKKAPHMIRVTKDGWEGVSKQIEKLGERSLSDFVERLGRGHIEVLATEDKSLIILKKIGQN